MAKQQLQSHLRALKLPTIYATQYTEVNAEAECYHCQHEQDISLVYLPKAYVLDAGLHSPEAIEQFRKDHPEQVDEVSESISRYYQDMLAPDGLQAPRSFYFLSPVPILPIGIKNTDAALLKKLTSWGYDYTTGMDSVQTEYEAQGEYITYFCKHCQNPLDIETLLSTTELGQSIKRIKSVHTPVSLNADLIPNIFFQYLHNE